METTTADTAFRKFLQCAHREHGRWQLLREQLKPLWRSLHEYDQMYAQVNRENADAVFGEDEFHDSLIINLRMKLEIARQDDLEAASETIKEMRSVFHSVRCALVQLEYDLDPLESMLKEDKSTNLRPSYGDMRETCNEILQGLGQDLCEVDYVFEMLRAHNTVDPTSIEEQFSELLFRFIIPLKPYLADFGVNLNVPKALPSTPKTSRVSLTNKKTPS